MSRVSIALLYVAAGLLGGCAQSPFLPKQARLELTLTATEQVNPDLYGRASPIVVRLFALRQAEAFERADFFSLYGRAERTLGKDLVSSKELELRPGAHVTVTLNLDPGSRYVGVLAAYRDLPHSQWRHVVLLPRKRVAHAELVLDQAGIRRVGPP